MIPGDAYDLRAARVLDLPRTRGIVLQKNVLFSGTIRGKSAMGKSGGG